ncbi:MAG: response regulator transcription factor [Bacteroidetes bacterium]|nr:response regulator transcription factor [Bacteroidota bacterium]MBI3482922.1 response regulator transcription factor [Bacteroidota bacterium]
MNKIQCIIIEDEKPAQEVLQSFLARTEWIDLKATFDDAISALDYLKTHDTDLIFLDIQVPSLSGIDFLKIVKNLPQVIITTAYSQHAIEAFELDVRDYLMKPFSFERFLKAVNRVAAKPDAKQVYQMNQAETAKNSFAFFNVNKTMVKVLFGEILHVESMREYIYIHTVKGRVITKMGIGEMEKMLGEGFLRIHRSYLVNCDKITSYNAEEIFIDKVSLPIGPNYKKFVEAAFGKLLMR